MKTIMKVSFWSYILPLIYPAFLFLSFSLIGSKLFLLFIADLMYPELLVSAAFLLLQIIPSLILNFNYYQIDKNKILTIDDSTNEVTITNKDMESRFRLDEIDRIRIINSSSYGNSYKSVMPWKQHYYYMICLKNDDEYLVTRFVARKLEKIINVRIVYKKAIFPFITKEVLRKAKNG